MNVKLLFALFLFTLLQVRQPGAGTSAFVNVKDHEVRGDGMHDDSQAIQRLIRSNTNLFFPKGVYRVNSQIRITDLRNLLLKGEPGTVFKTPQNVALKVSGKISNLEIRGISFVSDRVSDEDDAEGLIFIANYGRDDVMDCIRITQCAFSNPKTHANGIKLVSEGLYAEARNIVVSHNTFKGIGRMGVEFQNHENSLQRARFRDFEISHNSFFDVGTIQLFPAPSCISVSGNSRNGKINYNLIQEMRMDTSPYIYYGIENAGTIGLETIGNRMRASKYGFTGILGSGPTGELTRRTGQPEKSGWIIRDNSIELSGRAGHRDKIRGMELTHVNGYTLAGNVIRTDGYAAMFIDCRNGKIISNRARVKAGNAFYFKGRSTGNVMRMNRLDCSEGPDHGVVMFYGASVKRNIAFDNELIRTGGRRGKYVNLEGADNEVD
ncbi:pectate lyase-like protein [Arcticibacter pallidicorallinus]|uniref:Pectate lyase-like protein n=1 Tax=Arcticibacter pallidicorallinus TaxID=1259464 RepID=A0A2T0UBJ6_9SPHI|nr:glycoside hydrolase family 55 protein [Arcticibacter pallidicorallinus]PRY55315.1 pectate lyase-like protein [Arcticibacter pallidicorallinus]